MHLTVRLVALAILVGGVGVAGCQQGSYSSVASPSKVVAGVTLNSERQTSAAADVQEGFSCVIDNLGAPTTSSRLITSASGNRSLVCFAQAYAYIPPQVLSGKTEPAWRCGGPDENGEYGLIVSEDAALSTDWHLAVTPTGHMTLTCQLR